MNKYILVDPNDNIVDVFFSYQKEKKVNPDKIVFETEPNEIKHKINDKSICEENGFYIFKWDGSTAIEKTQGEIDTEYADEIIEIENDKKKSQLVTKQNKIILLLITLIDQLLEDGTIQGTDFSQAERDLYQAAKDLIAEIDWT